jgi:hypothetical protein
MRLWLARLFQKLERYFTDSEERRLRAKRRPF